MGRICGRGILRTKVDTPAYKRISPIWLSHGFLVTAAALTWNLLSLGYLVYDSPHILKRGPWWELFALGAFLLVLAITGLLRALATAKVRGNEIDGTLRIHWPFPLGAGFSTFLLGWLPCIYIMGKLMHFGYVCDTGAIAAMVVVWLPVGVVISLIASILGWRIVKRFSSNT